MSHVSFPSRWPPKMADIIQLYSMATPNGQKVSIALEEMGLEYEPHLVNITEGDQRDPGFVRISPNAKIPAIIDPNGPEGKRVAMSESAAILIYLADKTGKLLPQNYLSRMEHIQWLMFQMGHIGPFFGQFGHFFKFVRNKIKDDYPLNRYASEVKRLLGVLDTRLSDRKYVVDDFSIVDIAIVPWVNTCAEFYEAFDYLDMGRYTHVEAWRRRINDRPTVIRGRKVCAIR
jgi:GST-like protein